MTVKQCRESINKSFEEMAAMLDITSEEYMVYEKNPCVMPIDVALRFSEIVKIPYDKIFFDTHSI